MRFPVLTAAVLLAAAPAAFAFQEPAPAPIPAPKAQEPAPAAPAPVAAAPAKRENKISPEAKAVIDGYQKVVYNPIALGLKELKGTLVMKMVPPGMDDAAAMEGMPDMSVKFVIAFTAPKTLTIEGSTENPMLMQAVDQFKKGLEHMVLSGMGILEPQEAEFDMDVAVEGGAKVLVIKTYDKGAVQGEFRLVMNAEGLATRGSMRMTDPNSGMEQTIELSMGYVKEGDSYRLDSQSMTHPMFPEPFESKFTYSDAGGIKILTGLHTKGPMGMTMGYKYTELSVNGKKVELAEAKKEAAPSGTTTAPTTTDPSKSDPAPAPAPAEKKPE